MIPRRWCGGAMEAKCRNLLRCIRAAGPLNMQPVKAQVRNGGLLVDEPTDLPEGKSSSSFRSTKCS